MENLQVSNNVIITSPKKGRGQYERKARGSYQNEKKITIKLFLNKRLKADIVNGKKYYPPYIQVSLKSQTTFFRATIQEGMYGELEDSEKEYEIDEMNFDFNRDKILKIIEILKPFERRDFKVSEVALICTSLYAPIHAVIFKTLANSFGMIGKEDEKGIDQTADWYLIVNIILNLKDDEEAFSKIDQEFWYLEEYCKLISRKQLIQEFYKIGKYGLEGNVDLTLIGYLRGNFQKHLIDEIGEEKANRIIKSIDFVLETYFCKQIEGIKYFVDNFL